MRILAFTLLFFTVTVAYSEDYKEVQFGTFYETNTFYSNNNAQSAEAFFVKPQVSLTHKVSDHYEISTDSNLIYETFLKFANQSFFQYDLNLRNAWIPSKSLELYATPEIKTLSEPAQATTEDRLQRQYVGADTGIVYSRDDRRQYSFEFIYMTEALNQSQYQFLNNNRMQGYLYYKKYFLPETFFYYGFRLGQNQYPSGLVSPVQRPKFDSRRVEPGMGLEGRLTRYFKIRSYFGYAFISYTQDVGYRDPVFLLELEEEISPRDLVLMGFDNSAEDSYYTNYYIDNKVYLGYGRFLGDQLLSTTKVQYAYRSYSRPNRRNDQHIALVSNMEYSYSQKLKLDMDLLFDLLSSDAVDTGPGFEPDPSASYRNIRLSLYAKYLF